MGYLDPKPSDLLHKGIFFATGAGCGVVFGLGFGIWPLASAFPAQWFSYVISGSALGFGLYFGFLAKNKGDDFWPILLTYLRWPWR